MRNQKKEMLIGGCLIILATLGILLFLGLCGCASMKSVSSVQCFTKDGDRAQLRTESDGSVIYHKDCVIWYGREGDLRQVCGLTCGVRP